MIQEYVPGKQVTLAHIIASPNKEIYTKLGLPEGTSNALGILTITPSEAAIIAVDIATKSGDIQIGFIDRFLVRSLFQEMLVRLRRLYKQ